MPEQADLFELEAERTLLDTLFEQSRLYTSGNDYQNLLDFVCKLRNFAPFNALLLQVQKPGLTYAASAADWLARFKRTPKKDARPLIILWPFGPVALVYDILDTEGDDLPKDAYQFPAAGKTTAAHISQFVHRLAKAAIPVEFFDAGDGSAGYIQSTRTVNDDSTTDCAYNIRINRNHPPATQFATLAHELAHLYLGHLGVDKARQIPLRRKLSTGEKELEAESAAYIVCTRNGIQSRSHTYLSNYVDGSGCSQDIDVYQIMKAAGRIESALGLSVPMIMKPA